MKILFVGLGSIGRRHLKNLTKIFTEQRKMYEIHALRVGCADLPDDIKVHISCTFNSFDDINDFYDIVFITNPTMKHYETLLKVRNRTKKIFLEKPVFSDTNVDIVSALMPPGGICYVAAPLRYTRVFSYLKEFLVDKKVISVRAICSSYLPEWRPETDYRDCYSASKAKGGDIGLELIHEWDYLTNLFGFPSEVKCISGKYSSLEIDSDDITLYIARYKDKVVSLSLDYFGRVSRRDVEFCLSDDVVVGDFIHSEIRFLKSGRVVSLPSERDDYQKAEIEYFLSLKNNDNNINCIEHAFKVLRLAKGEL